MRTEEECAIGNIEHSINVPVSELSEALGTMSPSLFLSKYNSEKPLPSDRLIFYCRSGQRGNQAVYLASQNGFKEACNLAGGYRNYTDTSVLVTHSLKWIENHEKGNTRYTSTSRMR